MSFKSADLLADEYRSFVSIRYFVCESCVYLSIGVAGQRTKELTNDACALGLNI